MRYNAEEFRRSFEWPETLVGHRWVLCRPESDGRFITRLRDAWAVLTGRADALEWWGQP